MTTTPALPMPRWRPLRAAAALLLCAAIPGIAAVMPDTPSAHAAAIAPPADDAAELRRIKTEVWPRLYREQDVAGLDQLLAREFQMIDAEGAVSMKADELAWARDNRPGYERFRFEIDRLDVFENGTAVVSGRGIVEGRDAEGRATTTTYASSNVLIKRDGRWQAVASHVSGSRREAAR